MPSFQLLPPKKDSIENFLKPIYNGDALFASEIELTSGAFELEIRLTNNLESYFFLVKANLRMLWASDPAD